MRPDHAHPPPGAPCNSPVSLVLRHKLATRVVISCPVLLLSGLCSVVSHDLFFCSGNVQLALIQTINKWDSDGEKNGE